MLFQAPCQFDDEIVLRQLRYTGMLATVKIRQSGYNYRLLFEVSSPSVTGYKLRRGGGGVRDADQSRSSSPDTTAGYSLRSVQPLSQAVSFGKCVRDADQSRHGSWDSATSCSLGSTHHLHVFLLTSLGVEKYLCSLLLDFTQMF